MEAARNAQTVNVRLMLCHHCSFIFNPDFNANIMDYDDQYQNEQSHPLYFQSYLDEIIELFLGKDFRKRRLSRSVVEKGIS